MVINDEDEDSNTALHLAALAGHNKVVYTLLEAGADIEARNATLWTPLDCAAAKGWAKTVKVLLEADSPIDPMDKARSTPLHLASKSGHVDVVNLLIQWNANVSLRSKDGENCLDMAIAGGHKDVAMAIINSNRWKDALMNETLNPSTMVRDTPLRKLIRKMPDVAEAVFNKCTTSNVSNPDDPTYEIVFNFEFLDDVYADWRHVDSTDTLSSADSIYEEDDHVKEDTKPYSTDAQLLKKNHPLMIMVKADQEDLLAHPLVTTLLHQKWSSFGRYVYYLNLFVYCIFLTFLTGYIVTTDAPFKYYYNRTGLVDGLDECERVRSAVDMNEDISTTQHLFAEIGKYVIMALAGLNILRELVQLYNAKWNYFGWENLIEWTTYIAALLLVIDFNKCQEDTGIRMGWQWQLGAVAIFLGWMDLVLFIRKFPRFGIYVVMFTVVLSTFIQFFPVFLLFIVSFAMGFFVLVQNQYEFFTVGRSLIKTTVMMIGEFEFADVFLSTEDIADTDSPEAHGKKIYYSGISYVLFVVFIIIMSIIIMNLLVGLAVDDIKAVQEQAVLQRMAMQVELALDVEAVLPHFLRRKFVMRCHKLTPNKHSKNPFRRLFSSSSLSAGAITKALNPELDDIEEVIENQQSMQKQINGLKNRLKTMSAEQESLKQMVAALLKHHDIEVEEEDVQDEEGGQ